MSRDRLQQLLARYADEINREIRGWLAHRAFPSPFRDMMAYQLGYVDEHGNLTPDGRGKRFRPVLCLLACEASGGDWHAALPAAASVELLHNFSLIHDDIEDHDPARRHRPTVWKVWGEPHAINAGDGMFALAGRAILDSDLEVRHEVARAFQEATLDLTEGQYLDMSFETRHDVSPEEYLHMVSLKTGALLGFSLWAGACIGGAPYDAMAALRTFGIELGRAFQIYDDILGIWAPAGVTGKVQAKDVQNRKKTLPILIASELAGATERETLRRFLARESSDVAEVLAVLHSVGAREVAEREVRRHLDSALAAVDPVDIGAEQRTELTALAWELTGQRDDSSAGTVANR